MDSVEDKQIKDDRPQNLIFITFKTDVISAVGRGVEAIKDNNYVMLSALNQGITNLLTIAEVIKVKLDGIHQLNKIETINFENGSHAVRFYVELWNRKPENKDNLFYQAPYDDKQVEILRSISNVNFRF